MGWETVNLGALVENFSVKAKSLENFDTLPFYGVSNETGITTAKYAAEDKAESYKIIENGCFAYNPYRINVGSIAYLDSDEIGLISPAYVVFKTRANSIIPELLLRFLKSSEGLRQIKLYARGTVRQALRFEDLCKIELSIPDYEEQLDFYNSYLNTETNSNRLLEQQSHQLDLLKKLRQQILQDAVQGKLVPQDPNDEPASELLERIKAEKEQLIRDKKIKKDKPLPEIKADEIPFEIPEGWVWCRLGTLVLSYQNGISKRNSLEGDKVVVIRLADIKNREINLDDTRVIKLTKNELTKYLLESDDILITRVNGSLDIVGNFTLVKNYADNLTVCDHFIRMRLELNNIISKYILFLGSAAHVRMAIENNFKTTSGQKTINQGHIDNILIPLPPLSEQLRIVIQIERLMTICDELEQSIQQNQKYTQELLQVALKEALEPNH
jgi:type I restriction enzyme S subunit